jgi:hypothetical protein
MVIKVFVYVTNIVFVSLCFEYSFHCLGRKVRLEGGGGGRGSGRGSGRELMLLFTNAPLVTCYKKGQISGTTLYQMYQADYCLKRFKPVYKALTKIILSLLN